MCNEAGIPEFLELQIPGIPMVVMVTSRARSLRDPDRIPSTTPGAEPPRDAKDSGSARPHSTHLETSSTNRS